MKTVGILNMQGAVSECVHYVKHAGQQALLVHEPADLDAIDALVIPGGESTAISRLIDQQALRKPLLDFAVSHPVLGVCAGLILCSKSICGNNYGSNAVKPLQLIDCEVERNGFGRQADSFECELVVDGIGSNVPGVFIRAPYIKSTGPSVTTLASIDGKTIMAESGNILVAAFHPELTGDTRILQYFLNKIR